MEIKVLGSQINLLPERAIYLPAQDAVLIADVHFGKTTHFRKAGIAVPHMMIEQEIKRLQDLIEKHQPSKIYFLGDLFHSILNNEWKMLTAFIDSHEQVEFVLVKGNHDILSADSYNHANFKMVEEPLFIDQFVLSHHPIDLVHLKNNGNLLHFNGHIHPGVKVKGKARAFFNLPCFHLRKNQLTLPAFGKFTGLANIKPKKSDKVYGLANDKIFEVQ